RGEGGSSARSGRIQNKQTYLIRPRLHHPGPWRRLPLDQRLTVEGTPQLLAYLGGAGGMVKSQVIKAIRDLFARKEMSRRLAVCATSGAAAAELDGHAARCRATATRPRW